jgi:hypothetical protein
MILPFMWYSNLANKFCYYSSPVLRINVTLMHASPNQDPASHFDADPDPDLDPSFQIKAQNLEKVLT